MGEKGLHTKRILLVPASFTNSDTPIILPDSPVDAVPEALVHVDRDVVRTPDVEIDEVPSVNLVGDHLEEPHHFAAEGKPAVFWRDGNCGDVAMPFRALPFCFADNFEPLKIRLMTRQDKGVCLP